MTQPTAALYIRVSTRHQAEEGFSLDEQQRTLTALAEQRGWSPRLYIDAGLSGEGVDHRPEMLRLLADAKAGKLDVVAVVDESRLARDELSAVFIRHQLKAAGVMLSTTSGDRDLSDPTDAYVAGLFGLNSAFEQGLRTKKMTAGLRATAAAGFWPGGPPPFGYRLEGDPAGSRHKVLVIDEGEAAILREAVALVVDHGHTAWTARKVLNASGQFTRSGKSWYPQNLRFQLLKPHLAGTYTYQHNTGPIDIEIPPILTQSRWEALQATIRATPGERPVSRFYPLTGHIGCACGGSISGNYRKDRAQRFYKCSNTAAKFDVADRCPYYPRYMPADHLETQVWQAIYELLSDPARLRQATRQHIAASTQAEPHQRNQRASLARRLDELDIEETGVIRTHARGTIDETQLTHALDEIVDERQALRAHLDQLDLWEQRNTANRARLSQLHQLAADAKTRLRDASPQDQRRVYELLRLRIHMASDRTLDIQGSIPTHGTIQTDEDTRMISVGAPQHP